MQVERDAGSARGRGERRLRSWLRHERLTVAMAVAEATHHSSRGQRPATIITEVEEHEQFATATEGTEGSHARVAADPSGRAAVQRHKLCAS